MSLFIIFILIISEISLILSHIGNFSIWGIIIAFAAVLIMCKAKPRTVNVRGFALHTLHILPILVIAFLLFFQPYQYMDCGWDPGNYINTGVHTARTGSIVYHDKDLSETTGFIRSDGTGIKYPGLYIKDIDKGLVVPQFFHLYPVWIAIFYKLFGLKSVFYVNPFFALLNVILLFLIGKKIMGKGYGLLTACLLSLNVIQIWNSRFPTSEILGQFFLLAGFYFWIRYLEKNDEFFAFWAGVSFGEFLLVGITSILIIPIIIFYLLYRRNKKDIYFIIPFLLLLTHLVIQLITYSSVYFETVIMFFSRREIYFLILFFIAFLFFIWIFARRLNLRRYLVFLIPILFIYGYFIRLHVSGSLEALNLLELGNYLSFFGILIALFGLLIIINKEKNEGVILFAITALIFMLFFIYDKRMNSRYPFSLRRYVPVVIPAYCFFISYLCKKTGKFLSILIIPLVLIIPLNRCKDIITVRDHGGWLRFWSDFAEHMDDNDVYILNRYRWARPLSDIFGKNVIAFADYSESSGRKICGMAKNLIEEGNAVYYVTDSNKPCSSIVDFLEVYSKSYKGKYIEDSLTFPPKIKEQDICFRIFKITEIGKLAEGEYIIDIGEENIGLVEGFDKARSFGGIEGSARWTFEEAKLIIPWFGDNVEQDLTISACGMPKQAGGSEISIYINNQSVAVNYKIDEQIKEYSFHISSGSVNTGNSKRVVLTIKSNTWSPSEYGIEGYPDNLGVLLDYVKID